MIEKEMWDLLFNSVNPNSDKIVCPITGGLDSRVIAYILSLKGVNVVSYYIYTDLTKHNFDAITELCKICNVKDNYFIYAEVDRVETAIKLMSKKYYLKKYQFYTPAFNNVITG